MTSRDDALERSEENRMSGPTGRTTTEIAPPLDTGTRDAETRDLVPASRGAHRRPGPVGKVVSFLGAHPVWTTIVLLAVAAFVFAVNLANAPDFNIDETYYSLAGQHVADYNSVTFGSVPVRVHPPLFFIAVGGWLALFGKDHAPVLEAIHAGRYLNTIFDVAVVGLTMLLGVLWMQREDLQRGAAGLARHRGRILLGAAVLVATNAFVLRFGRLLLIEPMAITFSLISLAVAWALRSRPAAVYVPVVGATVGLALLVKEPALFLVAAPMIGDALRRQWRAARRHLAAMAVGAAVWGAFPLWEASNGDSGPFWSTQTFSIRRLLGLVQVSGLNRKGGSPLAAFTDTFWQYSGAYVVFLAGAVALAVGLWRVLVRRRPVTDGIAQLLGLGLLSYGFLAYSVIVGQSNEQLTFYSVPAAVLLVLAHPMAGVASTATDRDEPRAGTALRLGRAVMPVVILATVVLGIVGWAQIFLLGNDTATAKVEHFVAQHYANCTPINATGDPFHWYATLRTQPIAAFSNGPAAVAHGVHVFLVSPKDAKFRYGFSSPELNTWIETHGHEVYRVSSHTSESISVWQVGTVPTPVTTDTALCVQPIPTPVAAHPAPASRFGYWTAGLLVLDALGAVVWWQARKRRSVGRSSAGH